jgi:hypothetical protein
LAGLPKPSFVRPKLAAIEPSLIVHRIGRLSGNDLLELDRRLWQALGLHGTALTLLMQDLNLSLQPSEQVQLLAEKSLAAVRDLDRVKTAGVDVLRLRELLPTPPVASA